MQRISLEFSSEVIVERGDFEMIADEGADRLRTISFYMNYKNSFSYNK